MTAPFLFPRPKTCQTHNGTCLIGTDTPFKWVNAEAADPRLKAALERKAKAFQQRKGAHPRAQTPPCPLHIDIESTCSSESFQLTITSEGVHIRAGDSAGAFYAIGTLFQLAAQSADRLPCLEITDGPDLAHRGYMLDISRCKVPTQTALFELIDQLSALRYNTLQLYIEHTFAFKDAEVVWADASPIRAEEIPLIEAFCRARFIELVPNLNSFGHMERWLRHAPYRHLAESPDGYDDPIAQVRARWGSTLKPDADSLAFVDSLYAEYLPLFTSAEFNAGCDEPWELGRGASAERCEKEGKHQVYTDFVIALHDRVKHRGKRMQFWGDILMESPAQAARLPRDIIPVIWGYEADHPLDAQAEKIAATGLDFLIAPGTGTWLSFSGRWDNARANILAAARAATGHGARGILLTTWGDHGNLQPWATVFPPLALGGSLAWNASDVPSDETIAQTVDTVFFDGFAGIGAFMIAFGRCEKALPLLFNRSRLFQAVVTPEKTFEEFAATLPSDLCADTLKTLDALNALLKQLEESAQKADNPAALLAIAELQWGLDINRWALARLAKTDPARLCGQLRGLIGRLEPLWLARARIGGLYEAEGILRAIASQISPTPIA